MRFRYKEKRQKKVVKLNSILPAIIDEFQMKDSFILERIRVSWENITSSILSTHSIPDRIYRNTLYVSVDHPTFSNEIIMMKGLILDNITKICSARFRDIRIEVKKLDWNK